MIARHDEYGGELSQLSHQHGEMLEFGAPVREVASQENNIRGSGSSRYENLVAEPLRSVGPQMNVADIQNADRCRFVPH